MRIWSICLFLNFFVCLWANAQVGAGHSSKRQVDSVGLFLPILKFENNLLTVRNKTDNSIAALPSPGYYTKSLSFFCKKEWQLEKAIKFPVKMRLGSIIYTDKLEGKITSRNTE